MRIEEQERAGWETNKAERRDGLGVENQVEFEVEYMGAW